MSLTLPILLRASMLHFSLLVAFSWTLSGCTDALAFDLFATVDEFTVPGDPDLHHGKVPLSAAAIPDMEIQFSAIDARSISISSVRFFVTDTDKSGPSDVDDLTFLESVIVYVAPISASSDLPVIELARWDGALDPDGLSLTMDASETVDLRGYIQEGFVLQAATTGIVPYDDVSISGEAIFYVEPI